MGTVPNSTHHTFLDPHELAAAVRTADVDIVATEAGTFRAELTSIRLHRLGMLAGKTSLPLIARSVELPGHSSAFFPTGFGASPIRASGRELTLGDLAQSELRGEHHLRMGPDCEWASLHVSPEDLAAASRALLGRELSVPRYAKFVRPAASAMLRLRRLHSHSSELASTGPEIIAHPEVARAIEASLLDALVECLKTDAVAHRIGRHSTNIVMHRFEQALEAHQGSPIYIVELCKEMGTSERFLRRICSERLGMAPRRYLWLRRMHMARRALLLGDVTGTSVTRVATDCGFGELGRFSVEYRALFGESPSVTLRRPPDGRSQAPGRGEPTAVAWLERFTQAAHGPVDGGGAGGEGA